MKYDVYWLLRGVEDLFELEGRNRRQALRILIAVKMFGRDGHGDIKKLQGSDPPEWRLRAGDWRILMLLEGPKAYVTAIDNRRDAY